MAITAMHSAASGLSALSTELDVIANNLANINTTGFKASRANFQDLMYVEKKQPGVENSNGDERPMGLYVGLGTEISGTQKSFLQGDAQPTGDNLDIMIDGMGFLKVKIEDDRGPNGYGYTRAGALTINSEGDLVMANDPGRRLEPPINIGEDTQHDMIQITEDGQVYVLTPGDPEATSVGQIELSLFINPPGLSEIGENLFVESAASGVPVDRVPGEGNAGTIKQGVLESSNVEPITELISMIKTQRAFEMNGQVIRAADDTLQQISALKRR